MALTIRTGWLALLLLVACAPREALVSRDAAVPADVDLSGNWVIRDAGEERRLREAIRRTDGVSDDELFRRPDAIQNSRDRRAADRRTKAGLVHVFIETGNSLKVTQTEHGLFISFDRSVVEEFRFGENRMVSVGEVEAQRVTGWEGDTLVVETLDRNRMKLTERFRLRDGGRVLERQIILRSRDLEEETIVQLFDRVAS